MKHALALAALVFTFGHCGAQQPGSSTSSGLVHITEGGEFVEVERSADFSIVEVRSAPQGSVGASLFALRGACAVARARAQKYFTSTPLPGPFPTHRLSFPQAPHESLLSGPGKRVFTFAECELLRF